MKKQLLSLCLILCFSWQNGLAQDPKHEFRATWFTTVENIDWPKTYIKNASSRTQQQKELTDIFDKLVAGNMNAACMQVRSMCDAMYKSSYEPWSRALTEERGKEASKAADAYFNTTLGKLEKISNTGEEWLERLFGKKR